MATLLNNSQHKALTTLARAKDFLGIGSTSHDSRLTLLINIATQFIEEYTKRNLLSQTYTNEEYDGTGTEVLVLEQFPVTALSSLQYNRATDNTDDWETIETTRYQWYEDGRVKLVSSHGSFLDVESGHFIPQENKYRVTFVAGYLIDFDNENTPASHTLPFDLEYACLKLVSAMFNTRRAEGFSATRVGDVSANMKQSVFTDTELKVILDKYVRASI